MRHLLTYRLFEATQETKTLPPVKTGTLLPPKLTPAVIASNKEIAKMLADNNVKLNANPNSSNFLPQVSKYFLDNGFEPYLSINTDDQGGNQSLSPGVTFTVPNRDISFDIQPGYYGTSLPFIKGTSLGVGYQPGKEITGGYRDSLGSQFSGNAKYMVSLTIPLTR